MRQMLEDKRIRYLFIAVLAVVLVLGLLNIISTAFSLLVPLAILAAGAFAFYKIVLEGRDRGDVMQDEVAESASAAIDSSAGHDEADAEGADAENEEAEARQRLSSLKRAQDAFFDTATPAEEILDQIRSRKQRLSGGDE